MPIALTNIRDILLPGLMMTPEERAEAKRVSDAYHAKEWAAEKARYDAMSEDERREYDAFTEAMMPRLRKRDAV